MQSLPARSLRSSSIGRRIRPILYGTIAACLLGLPAAVHAITDLDLLPWGATAGDINTMTSTTSSPQTANGGVDDGYALVNLNGQGPDGTSLSIPFYDSTYNSLYVDSNGLLSFTQGVSTWVGQHFPINPTIGPLVAGYWGDVDTRSAQAGGAPVQGTNSGLLWFRTATDAATMNRVGSMITAGFGGISISGGSTGQVNFTPTTVEVATWDHVGSYGSATSNTQTTATFQIIIASDGVQSYAIFLYPQGEQNWLTGAAGGPPPQAGFDAGDGTHFYDAAASQTTGMTRAWALSNTVPATPGMQIFRIDSGSNPILNLSGSATTTTLSGSKAYSGLILGASGNTFTATTAGSSVQFDTLALPVGGSVNFTGSAIALTGPNSVAGITQGDLNFTDTSIFVARGNGAVAGGAFHLSKSAQFQIYNSGATTSATALSFDKSAGGTGGTLDLRGFNTAFGPISSTTAGSGVITNSGSTPSTLTVSFDSTSSSFDGVIQDGTGGLSLVKSGTGTLHLTSANTFTGTTTINKGTLDLANTNALQNSTATLNGGALTFTSASAITLGGLAGSGNLVLFTSTPTPHPVSLTVGGNGATTSFSGTMTGAGGLTKKGNGTLTLSLTSSYDGATSITAGTLQFATAASLYNSTSSALNAAVTATNLTVQSGATAAFNVGGTNEFTPTEITTLATLSGFASHSTLGVDTTNAPGAVNFTAPLLTPTGNTVPLTLNKLGTGTMALGASGVISSIWSVVATGGTIDIGSFNQNVANLQLAGGNLTGTTGTFTSNSAYDLRSGTIGAKMAGSVAVNKTTAGTVNLSGANTYTGITTVSAGTLQFANPTALYNSTTSALSASVTGTNLVVQSGAMAAFNVGGNNDFTPAEIVTLAGLSGFQSGSSIGLDTSNAIGAVALTTPLVSPNSGATAITLTKLGTGTLAIGANNAIGTSFTVAVPSGTLDLGSFNDTVAGLQLTGGTVTGGSGSLLSTSAFDLRAGTVSAILTGSVALNKTTAGTVTLSRANTYTGGTNLSGGILNVAAANALGTSGTISFNGGTLQFSAGSTQDYSLRFSVAAGQQYRFDTNGQNVTLTANIASTGSTLTKLGAGSLALSGIWTPTGSTSVLGGTLVVSGSLNGTAGIAVGDGINPATLSGTGTITPTNSGVLAIKNGATLAPGFGNSSGLTYKAVTGTSSAGAFTGTAALDFQSGSTFQLAIGNSQFATHGAPSLNDYAKLTLGPGATATLNGQINIALTSSVNQGDVFPILLSSIALPGHFTNATQISSSTYILNSGGQYWEINYAWNSATPQAGITPAAFAAISNGTEVALLALPEPGSALSLLGGSALLLGWSRRRRH